MAEEKKKAKKPTAPKEVKAAQSMPELLKAVGKKKIHSAILAQEMNRIVDGG